MTHFTANARPAIRQFHLPKLNLPRLSVGISIDAFAQSIRQAVAMAYVDPFILARNQAEAYDDAELEGRDPNW